MGVLVVLGGLAAASGLGLLLGRSGRRLGSPKRPGSGVVATGAEDLSPADLGGEPLGERATLVQFSSAFCQPCRATRSLLERVSGQVDGVRHVEIDAESQLELVRRLDIRRTPTVLVLDRHGRVVRRASGQPRHPDVVAAIDAALLA